jgi:hypothetical protein
VQALTTHRLALLTTLSALCIGIQLTPRPPNVEFTSLIVFLVGASSGIVFGGLLAAIVRLYGRTKKGIYDLSSCSETAVLGAFLTLVYDIITNFGVAVSYMLLGVPMLPAFISAIIFGAPLSAVHVVSNFFVFLVAFFPLTRILQKSSGGERVWRKDALPT